MFTHVIRTMTAAALFSFSSFSAAAGWIQNHKITEINLAANELHGFTIKFEGAEINGECASTPRDFAFVEGSNPNYDSFLSTVLYAKSSDLNIRVRTSGCVGSFYRVVEIILP